MATKKTEQEKQEPGKTASAGKTPAAAPLKKGKIKPVVPSSVKK